jgi:ankyrin repeat protein
LQAGANPNIKDQHGLLPLQGVVCNLALGKDYELNINILKLLLQYKADVNIDMNGITLLHTSLALYIPGFNKKIEPVEWLLQAGAEPNAKDGCGQTPLHYVVASKREQELVNLLLQYKADPDIIDFLGRTALYLACEAKDVALVKLFLNARADPRICNNWGKNMLSLVNDCPEIKSLLDAKIAELEQNEALAKTRGDVVQDPSSNVTIPQVAPPQPTVDVPQEQQQAFNIVKP